MFGRTLHSVVWQQGTLIAPQHLQHQDAAHTSRLAARLYAAVPNNTGVVHLEVDTLGLQEGRVGLPAGLVVMPCGEVIEWQSQPHSPKLTKRLPDPQQVPDTTLHVFVVLPKQSDDAPNTAHSADGRDVSGRCRYRAQPTSLPEITRCQTPPIEVMLAEPNVHLAFAHELRGGDSHLHIMTLLRQPNGSATVDATFMPQSLRISACPQLVSTLCALHAASGVAAQHARAQLFRGGPAEAVVRQRGLVQLYLTLEDLLADASAGPHAAYALLRRCLPWIGHEPPELPEGDAFFVPYDHAQPGLALWPLIAAVQAEVAQGPSGSCSFDVVQMGKSGLFLAKLAPWPGQSARTWFVEVRLAPDHTRALDAASREQAITAWQRLAKVAAPSQMPKLIRSALRGVGLSQVDVLPPGMVSRPGTVVFALDTDGPGWAFVQNEQELALLPPPGHAIKASNLTVVCFAEGQT